MPSLAMPDKIAESVRDLLSETQAADLLQVAPGTLSVWRCTGRYALPFVKIGARVRYRRGDLQAWLDSRVRGKGTPA
jgi:hypothetical protein